MASLITDKKELPRAFGNSQPAYSELSNLRQKQDRAEVRKGSEKQMEGLIQMYVASLKNQDPFSEKSNTESGVQIAGTTATISSLNQISEQVEDLIDNSKKSQLLNASEFQGQEVYYDDSMREYRGRDVEFSYELKGPNHLPADAPIKTTVKIFDEKGTLVFSTKVDGAIIGKNEFLWNGRDNSGKEAKKGQYKIEVIASSPASSGLGSVPIEATSYLSGVVEAIDTKDGVVKLLVNGKLIDQNQVKKIVTSSDKAKSNQKPSADRYVSYIGKKVSIDLSRIEVKGGKAEIAIKNSVANPGKVRLEVYGENSKYIKTVEYVAMPENSKLVLDARKYNIPDGKYTCKVYVEDKDNDNKMTLLDKTDQIDVTSVDLATGQITDGKKTYSVKNIAEVTGQSGRESSLITQGGYYIGKQVEFVDDSFVFNGESYEVAFPVYKPSNGRTLGDAEVQIYKYGQHVRTIIKRARELYEEKPMFNELNDDSKLIVNDYIATNPQFKRPGVKNYNNLNNPEKRLVDNYIEKEFRAGHLFKTVQDKNDKLTKLKNMGVIVVEWNGELDSGDRALANQEYTYKIFTSTTTEDGNDRKLIPFYNHKEELVKESTVIDGTLKLVLSNGKEISTDDVIRVG